MIPSVPIDYSAMVNIAKNGSPVMLQALGRLYGLGPNERRAMSGDSFGMPGWLVPSLMLAAGVVIGVQVYKRWPQYVPSFVKF